MTVTGALSAQVASASYVPPFKYVTSYPADPQVTGTVTSALPVNPTVTASSDDAFATAYLQAHMMSWPSYRYAYLLWMVLAALAAIYAIAHHLRLSGGSIGAGFSKWGMRRKPVGTKKQGGARGRALPINSVLVAITIIAVVTFVLCVIGSDYINPSSSTLNFATSFRKRASVGYTINKAWWTAGSRFGFMAFALTPLVVLFALKAPPIAIFALRPFTHVFSDKLALFHRAAAWIVWGLTSIHVALWTVQLFQDQRNGRAVWFYIWNSYRFIFGCVAYGMMTAVMALSLKRFRKNSYEFFYYAHVVFVFLTIVCSAIHHPVLWFWMAAALGLWGAERAFRLLRLARINGMFGKKQTDRPLVAGKPYQDATQSYGMQDLKRAGEYDPLYTDKTLPQAPAPRAATPELHDFGRPAVTGYYDEGSLQPLGSYESRVNQHQRNEESAAMPRSDSYATIPRNDSYSAMPRSESYTAIQAPPPAAPTLPSLVPVSIPVGYAQAQLLPSRTVRLTINLARPLRWAPGQSVLLYLPDLSRFQSHPFTIINNDPNELVLLIKARKGLTRRLFDLVRARSLAAVGINNVKNKRISLASMRNNDVNANLTVPPIFIRAWVDGPMGSSERVRWREHSSVLIICGGSGVSFGSAVCEHVCRNIKNGVGRTRRVRFCWVVREYAEIAWVAGHLRRCQDLVTAEQLQIDIFVTNASKARDDFAPPRPGFAQGGLHQRRGSADSLASEMSVDSPTNDFDETVDTHLSSSYADVIDLTNYEDEEDVNDPVDNQLSENMQQQGKVRRAKSRKAAKRRSRPTNANANAPSAYPPARHSSNYDDPRLSSAYDQYENPQGYDSAPARRPGGYDEPSARNPHSSGYDEYLGHRASGSGYNEYPQRERGPFADDESLHASRHSLYVPPSAPMMTSSSSHDRRQSYRSLASSINGPYDPFEEGGNAVSPSPSMFFDDNRSIVSASASARDILARTSRTQSMVLLEDAGSDPAGTGDAGLWIDEADHAAMSILSEVARPGKPKLSSVVEEEIQAASGSMIVTTCGPVTLNTVVRNLVSKHISPARLRRGDRRGHIAIYSEDYEV